MKFSRMTVLIFVSLVILALIAVAYMYSAASRFVRFQGSNSAPRFASLYNTGFTHSNDTTNDLDRHENSHNNRFSNSGFTKSVYPHTESSKEKLDTCCNVSLSTLHTWKRQLITEISPRIKSNCLKLQKSDREQKQLIKNQLSKWKSSESDKEWLSRLTKDCSSVIKEFEDASFYISEEEINFPLAFIFVIYNNPRQIVRLLKAIYRPQNLYCIHPDARQGEAFASLFRHLSKCLPNVIVASKLEHVYYMHHSLMDAQMNCMRDLLEYDSNRWKFVINICGRELPLKTNREIVQSLSKMGGNTILESSMPLAKNGYTMKNRFKWKVVVDKTSGRIQFSHQRLPSPPHNITIYKSSTFLAAQRNFIDFILNNPIAKDLHEFMKGVQMPEEHFYASIFQYAITMPNSTIKWTPVHPTPRIMQVLWLNKKNSKRCEGLTVHKICVVSSSDLDIVYSMGVENKRSYFFFNKYFMEKDHVVMDCMEEHLVNANRLEYEHDCGHV